MFTRRQIRNDYYIYILDGKKNLYSSLGKEHEVIVILTEVLKGNKKSFIKVLDLINRKNLVLVLQTFSNKQIVKLMKDYNTRYEY